MIRIPTIPRSPVIALAAVAVINLLGASDCARVDNSVTAPGSGDALTAPARNECAQDCNRRTRGALYEENALHDLNVQDCDGGTACLDAEAQRHAAALEQIRTNHEECLETCHEQGAGSGGQ